MQRASVQVEVDDSDESSNFDHDADIKDEPLSDEGEFAAGMASDKDLSFNDIEVKEECKDNVNFGMASVMAKILNKPTEGSAIMSKSVSERLLAARKRKHLENAEPGGNLEVVKSEGGKLATDKLDVSRKKLKKTKQATLSIQEKHAKEHLCHTLPDPLDKPAELNLIKIATRGVVQLFNAVKQQQGNIKEKVDAVKKSVRKTDKAISEFTSGDFLDRLKTQKVKTVGNPSDGENAVKQEIKEEPTWSALRDDFMMGSQSMKDWDKEDSEGSSNQGSVDLDEED
ncbi:RRP15-like protein [Watersipora subatra]|uniref:RRP15-like protein n=1 Tax=Watersipora subatra TaxID=2589382 RepID=UPI00355AFB40